MTDRDNKKIPYLWATTNNKDMATLTKDQIDQKKDELLDEELDNVTGGTTDGWVRPYVAPSGTPAGPSTPPPAGAILPKV